MNAADVAARPPREWGGRGPGVPIGAMLGMLLLCACAAGPDYQRPSVETPAAFKEARNLPRGQPDEGMDRGAWWAIYDDAVLDGLEQQIDISNQNLKSADAAYRAAVAVAEKTRANLFPSLTLDPSAIRSIGGKSVIMPAGTAGTVYDLPVEASWAPDLWGRIRRSLESDEANAEVSAADYASARLSAQALLATNYFDLRAQDELSRLLQATVQADNTTLKLVQGRYAQGVATEADVFAAQTQLETVQSQAINAGLRRAQLEHAIAVLVGRPPADVSIAPLPFTHNVPATPNAIPSALLQRRPDIAAAERAMAAANAQIGVAKAAWFPNLTLSASYGFTGSALGKLVQAPNSLWTVGGSLAETIFDAGAREAGVKEANAEYDQAVAGYRQTVLTAFQQVEDELAAQRILGQQAKTQQAAVISARNTQKLALYEYAHGIESYDSVLSAQIIALNTEQNALALTSAQIDANIALIETLGGGWHLAEPNGNTTIPAPPADPRH